MWVRATSLHTGDRTIFEGEVISVVLQCMLEVDQLNAPNLVCAELLMRRRNLLREPVRMSPGSPDYSMSDHYMGWGRRRGGNAIAPDFQRHIARIAKEEADVAKEHRRRREEQTLKRAPGKKKGAQGGGKGGGK